MLINIDVDKIEKNKIYSKKMGLEQYPFFIVGDSISGNVFISSSVSSTTPPPNYSSSTSFNENSQKNQNLNSSIELSESTNSSNKLSSSIPRFSMDLSDDENVETSKNDGTFSSTAPERNAIIPSNHPSMKVNQTQMKFKSIKVQLVASTYVKNNLINSSVLQAISLIDNEKISFPYTSEFVFLDVKPPYTSFIGPNTKIEFRIEVICEKSLRTFQNSVVIYFIKPQNIQQNFREQKITVQSETPKFNVSASIQTTFLSTDELINGNIYVGDLEENSLKKASIIITSEESVKHPQYQKQFETRLVKYQVIEGTPISNRSAPFLIQLSALKLWSLQPSKDCLIRFKLSLILFVESTDGETHSVTQTLGLYQKSLI